jgi:hypothetical protein
MAARPPEGATFEITPIGRPRSRAPLAVVLWSAALVGIVAVGALGRSPDASASAVAAGSEAPVTGSGIVPSGRPATVLGTDLALVYAIDLRVPAVGPVTLTTPDLNVFGEVMVHAALVEVSLEARNNRVIDTVDIDVTDPNGGLRRDNRPQFEVDFPVPYPRPNGTMWVVVTAYDAAGIPLGGERRPFLVGPIIQPRLRILDFRDS